MRARWGPVVGIVGVGLLAGLMLAVVVTTDHRSVAPSAPAAERFVTAWERSRTATYLASGTFERRSEVTGSSIASEDVVAQRPPQRLHRQLGGVTGRDDDRRITCPAPPEGEDPVGCQLGPPTGRTYDEDVAAEVAGLRSLVLGPSPVYSVSATDDDCFALEQLRTEPRAPFGAAARFCFDADTGAPVRTRVTYSGGIVETVVVTEARGEVSDADLQP